MPEPDATIPSLTGLLPEVDLAAATEAFGRARARRRRRRRALGGLAVTVVLLGGAVAVAAARSGPDPRRRDRVVADQPPSDRQVVVRSAHGVRMTVDAPRGATVGTNITFTVRLRNVSHHDVPISAKEGDCGYQVQASIRPADATGSPSTTSPGPFSSRAAHWNGDLALLPRFLDRTGRTDRPLPAHHAETGAWARSVGCTAEARGPVPLHPGEERTYPMTMDLRWGRTAVPRHLVLAVWSGPVVPPKRTGPIGEEAQVVASLPFALHDDPVRAASVDEVLAGRTLADAPTFAAWVEETRTGPLRHTPGTVQQQWTADLSWWRGRWELWVDPQFGNMALTGSLLVRYDPARHAVVDVRETAYIGTGAADDPEAPPGQHDHVRYHRD